MEAVEFPQAVERTLSKPGSYSPCRLSFPRGRAQALDLTSSPRQLHIRLSSDDRWNGCLRQQREAAVQSAFLKGTIKFPKFLSALSPFWGAKYA